MGRAKKAATKRKPLRQFRESIGLSLDELANRTGLSKSMISKYELGIRDLSPDALNRLYVVIGEIAMHGFKREREAVELATQMQHQRNRLIEILRGASGTPFKQWLAAELQVSQVHAYVRDQLPKIEEAEQVVREWIASGSHRAQTTPSSG